ncbi:MAG: hypothetical protein NTU64_17670 [Hyphomicrobiales bacterium]|nr:hypothetical protein [Hyphomicrobiales bacterium]
MTFSLAPANTPGPLSSGLAVRLIRQAALVGGRAIDHRRLRLLEKSIGDGAGLAIGVALFLQQPAPARCRS